MRGRLRGPSTSGAWGELGHSAHVSRVIASRRGRIAPARSWAAYRINPRKQGVHVFVSLVSTRVPFKGTGKEHIAYEVGEVQRAVKAGIEGCCRQLRARIVASMSEGAGAQRRRSIAKVRGKRLRAAGPLDEAGLRLALLPTYFSVPGPPAPLSVAALLAPPTRSLSPLCLLVRSMPRTWRAPRTCCWHRWRGMCSTRLRATGESKVRAEG